MRERSLAMKVTALAIFISRPRRPWRAFIPGRYWPEHTRRNAMRSRCCGSIFAWILNTKPVNAGSLGSTSRVLPFAKTASRGCGGGAQSTSARSTSRTPKLLMPEPKNTGDCWPLRNSSKEKTAPAPHQFHLFAHARHLDLMRLVQTIDLSAA